jgi:predicted nucleic acid-binding protein
MNKDTLIISDHKCTLILDDLRARKYAKKINLNVIGTIGIIAKAETRGIISRGMTLIEKIQHTNFRLSEKILEEIKKYLKP